MEPLLSSRESGVHAGSVVSVQASGVTLRGILPPPAKDSGSSLPAIFAPGDTEGGTVSNTHTHSHTHTHIYASLSLSLVGGHQLNTPQPKIPGALSPPYRLLDQIQEGAPLESQQGPI